jgi:hypothetical protein
LDTGDNTVSATELHLTYDASKLEAQNIIAGSFLPVVLTAGTVGNGTASIILGSQPDAPKKGTGILASISFKALTSSSSRVDFASTTQAAAIGKSGNVVENMGGSQITVTAITSTPSPSVVLTPTPSDLPTPTLNPSITPLSTPTGNLTPTIPLTPTITPSPNPSISPTITPPITPTPTTNLSITPTSLPTPTGSSLLQVKFKARLAFTQNNPEMYFKLRVKDDLTVITGSSSSKTSSTDTCNNPPNGVKDYYVPVKADSNGVYIPVTKITPQPPSGVNIASVSSDGWVTLDGLEPNRHYTFILKGPKTRGRKTAEHVILQTGTKQSQDFDWSEKPLEPGDLPNPTNNNRQDCIINSLDLSLIISNLAKTDQPSLDIADVNYDGVVNGNDLSKVINTLSTKEDDDT